jgi:hypothetical protein
MGRRRKKPKYQISTRSAIILSGSIVAVVFAIILFVVIRSSFPSRNRGWDDPRGFRDIRPAPLARTTDEAWKMLKGNWGRTDRVGNAVTTIEYEFTEDRRVVFRSSLSGGVLPQPQKNQIVNRIVGLELDDGDILLSIEGGQGEMTLWFESPTVLVVEGEEFQRRD